MILARCHFARTRRLLVPEILLVTMVCDGRGVLPHRMPAAAPDPKNERTKVPFNSGSSTCYTYKMSSSIASGAETETDRARNRRVTSLVSALGRRSIVLIGLMGSGKTTTGRRLAQELGLEFVDADEEIEAAARMSITEIFERHGEDSFRDGERRVMARLLGDGPRVLASGGGAFMNEETRAKIALSGISIWLKADQDVLWRRVRKRSHRPLLQGGDPEQTLRALLEQRYPVYALADVTIVSRDGPHELAVEEDYCGHRVFFAIFARLDRASKAKKHYRFASATGRRPATLFEPGASQRGAWSADLRDFDWRGADRGSRKPYSPASPSGGLRDRHRRKCRQIAFACPRTSPRSGFYPPFKGDCSSRRRFEILRCVCPGM